MNAPKVNIIILNYRNWQDSLDCLQSVLASDYSNYSIYLIDNASGNRSLENIAAELPGTHHSLIDSSALGHVQLRGRLTFIQHSSNEGFAAGNNLVIRLLQEEDGYMWLLNPDMTVQAGTLSALVSFAIQQKPESIIGAEVRSFAGNHDIHFYGGGKVNFLFATVEKVDRRQLTPELDYISGASLFTRSSNVKNLGLLPEDYFLYWEETDWCYRAKLKGYDLCVCQDAICYDKVSTIIGRSYKAHYYYARNGLLFISRFRKGNVPVVLFFMGLRFFKRVVMGRWGQARGIVNGTIDFLKKKA